MLFTLFISCAPRYWLMRIMAASVMTLNSKMTTVIIWFALPTAATAVSLKWLSCTWSILPTRS